MADEKGGVSTNSITNVPGKVIPKEDDSQLQEVIKIAEVGAPGLAVRMMDRVQKDIILQS